MRQYNVIAVTKSENPNITNFFGNVIEVIQFNPNRGFNCVRIIYDDGTSEVVDDVKVKSTYRYNKTNSKLGVCNCGDHAIIMCNDGHFVIDFTNDVIKFVSK